MGTQEGAVSGRQYRTDYQSLVSKGDIDKMLTFGIFTKHPYMQAIGLKAYGAKAISDFKVFGKAAAGSCVKRSGGTYVEGSIFDKDATLQHVGRMGSFTPNYFEGGDNWAYAWSRLTGSTFIPDMDIQDNAGVGKIIDIQTHKMQTMANTVARDFNYCILGNSSAPDYDTAGPSLMKSSLNYALGVTDVTVGGISQAVTGSDSASTSYWAPQRKAITSLGGGDTMDRPITLRRSMLKVMNDASAFAEQINQYLLLCTQGAWQTWDRLQYADAVEANRSNALGKIGEYDAAGIEHKAFNGNPMVWDPATPVPNGATASTEAIYGINLPNYEINFHQQEGFTMDGWEGPRLHDQTRTHVLQFRVRYTPVFRKMRPHFLAYNIPANAD